MDLAELHHHLDKSVASAYGWGAEIAQRAAETNRALRELNAEIAAGDRPYVPF